MPLYPATFRLKTFEEMHECPICLENIQTFALLGRVLPCLHTYHEQCLIQWSSHSNSCPTCRKLFHKIDIIANHQPNLVQRSIPVKDKIIENDAINEIPQEFIIPPQIYGEVRPEEPDRGHNGVCTICSSAQYSRRNKAMVSCIGCGATFHTLCLGHKDEPDWYCPVCDCHQEMPIQSPIRVSRRLVPAPRRGLTIFNENNEIEDFDDREHPTRSASVLNGGVLLRREARQLESLTKEEADSWSLLELVRHGSTKDIEVSLQHSTSEKRKRRKRTDPSRVLDSTGPLDLKASNSAQKPSRFGSLMNQIRSGSSSVHMETNPPVQEVVLVSETIPSLPSGGERSLTRRTELSFEQKHKVQKYVRDRLRPRYIPNSESLDPTIIKSESEYIKINKAISRKVYAGILSLFAANPDQMDEIFEKGDLQLRDLVNEYADLSLNV